jgi:uncharacterized protein (UPF0335 family)
MADDGSVASDQLRQYIERAERVMEEIAAMKADLKDVFLEAKGQGFDAPTMKAIIKLRAMDADSRREREALLDTYKAALGMLDGTPLGHWALERLKPKKPEPAPPTEEEQRHVDDMAEYIAAVALVRTSRKASASFLQRSLKIGYNSAAALIERMQSEGIVSEPDATGKREVLADAPEEQAAPPPEPTVADARAAGKQAALNGQPVTANPFPAFDERRAAWDEAWCAELGSDGMDIPDALKPTPKPKKADKKDDGE